MVTFASPGSETIKEKEVEGFLMAGSASGDGGGARHQTRLVWHPSGAGHLRKL